MRVELEEYLNDPTIFSTEKFVAHLYGWTSDYLDPSNWYPRLWTSNSDYFSTHWRSSAFDAQVAKADVILDPAVRKLEYEKAEAMLMQGMPTLPLVHYSTNAFVKPYVVGYVSSPSGAQDSGMFGPIKILAHDQE